MMLLSQVIPVGLEALFVCDRADQLADGLRWLIGALPLASSLAIKTALIGAARAGGLGGLDLLDPLDWRLRGVALDKGLAVWCLPEEKGFIWLIGVHREHDARETFRALCASQSEVTFEDLGGRTEVREGGAVSGAFGLIGGYFWFTTRATSGDEARAALDMLQAAFGGQVDEVARRVLAEAPGAPQALRFFMRSEEVPFAMAFAVVRDEIEITLRIDQLDGDRDVLLLLAARSPERNLARYLPRGALAVLSGIDLGLLLGDDRPRAPVVGIAVLREIEPEIVSMLRRKASAEELLRAGVFRATVLARVGDGKRWRELACGAAQKSGEVLQRRTLLDGERTIYSILRGDACLWVTFERDLMIVALSEQDMEEARETARSGLGGLESSIDDVEARRLLIDGEPLIHVRIADLTERFSGLVRELWSERELAAGFGVRELLNFMARLPDATAQITQDAPEDGQGMDAWLKIRVR